MKYNSAFGPNMADVVIGSPIPNYRPSSIGQGLMDIAAWFDVYDDRCGYEGERQVQNDLRAWAVRTLDMPVDDKRTEGFCHNCRTILTSNWYKCCPTHTTERGTDVICEKCYVILHPEVDEDYEPTTRPEA